MDDEREKLLKILRCGIFVGGGHRMSMETRAAHAAAALDAYDASKICPNCGASWEPLGIDEAALAGTIWANSAKA